eukprot:3241772-Rhodomonas_salina.1
MNTDFGRTRIWDGLWELKRNGQQDLCILTRLANTELMNGTNSERSLHERQEFSLSRVGGY